MLICSFIFICFTEEISSFLVQVKKLDYTDKPNYNQLRDIFTKGLTKLGIKDTWKLALPIGGAPKPSTSSPKVNGNLFREMRETSKVSKTDL